MAWEANTSFSEVKDETRLTLTMSGQVAGMAVPGAPPAGTDMPLVYSGGGRTKLKVLASSPYELTIEVDEKRWKVTPRREGEFSDNIRVRGMVSREWVVREPA